MSEETDSSSEDKPGAEVLNRAVLAPALTTEEWEHSEFVVGDKDRLFGFLDDDGKLRLSWNAEPMRPIPNTAPLAALALYGQPFGFRRVDVLQLHELSKGKSPLALALRSIADRIEALLPPDKS